MPEIIDLLKSAAAIDDRLKATATVVKDEKKVREPLRATQTVALYKLTNGAKGERASKAGLTLAEADAYQKDHPENKYELVYE